MTPVPFAFTSGPHDAKVVLVGEAHGEGEAEAKAPFVRASGKELWRMLGEAWPDVNPREHRIAVWAFDMRNDGWISQRNNWLNEASVLLTNVLDFRPPSNSLEALAVSKAERGEPYPWPQVAPGKYIPRSIMAPQVERLLEEIKTCKPNLVICFGNTALGALMHTGGIGSVRGAITESVALPGQKVLPTYHPAAVLRNWAYRPTVLQDLMKARREMDFPDIRRMKRYIIINPCFEDLRAFLRIAKSSSKMAIDIETEKGTIKCIGFATGPQYALVIPFMDKTKPGWSYWPPEVEASVWDTVRQLCDLPCQKIFQNGLYDIQYLWKAGCPVRNMTADTMLLHHSMYPELPKSLGFLGSIYTNEAAWKLMRKGEELKRDE